MNDRMYELINQCFIGTTDGRLSELNTISNVERFAELIVRECADRCDQSPYPHPNYSVAIKKHFGVE